MANYFLPPRFCLALLVCLAGFVSAGPAISWRFERVYRKVVEYNYCGYVSLCESCCQRKWFGNCVEWGTCCNYRTYAFGEWQKDIIRMAFRKIFGIIQHSNVSYYAHRDDAGNSISLLYCRVSVKESRNDFRDLQWSARWPTVNVRPYVGPDKYSGRACVGTVDWNGVTKTWRGNGPRVGATSLTNGEVTVDINTAHINKRWRELAASDCSSSSCVAHLLSDEVAGTIVHEVLHQMGHHHDCTFRGKKFPPYEIQDNMAFFITRIGVGVRKALDVNPYVRRLGVGPSTPRSLLNYTIDQPLYENLTAEIFEAELEDVDEDFFNISTAELGPDKATVDEALTALLHERESDPNLEDTINMALPTRFEDNEDPEFEEFDTSGMLQAFGPALPAMLSLAAILMAW